MAEKCKFERPSGQQLGARVRQFSRAAYQQVQFRFPAVFPRRFSTEELNYYRERDAEENEATTPALGDGAEMVALWAVEYYTPSHYPNLLASFRRLGWHRPDDPHRDPGRWLENQRSRGYAAGTFNIGVLVQPDDTRRVGDGWKCPLPEFCQYATAQLVQLNPSLSAIVVGFVLKPERRRDMEAILRTRYTTASRPSRRGHWIFSPELQKRNGVAGVRAALRSEVRIWLQTHLAGVFSTGAKDDLAPTCEVLILDETEPFSGIKAGEDRNPLLEGLDIEQDYDAWRWADKEELRFTSRFHDRDHGLGSHAAMAVRKADLSRFDLKMYGGEKPESFFAYLHTAFDQFIVDWSLWYLLMHYDRLTSEIRDAHPRPSQLRQPQQLLRQLRDHAVASADIAVVAPDIISDAENDRRFRFFPRFCQTGRNGEPIDLADSLRQSLLQRARRLLALDRAIRDLLLQQSSLTSAHENIRLQQKVMLLTVAALMVAVASIIGQVWPQIAPAVQEMLQ